MAPVIVGGVAYRSMVWEARVAGLPPGTTDLALQQALQRRLDELDQTLSTYRSDSELMRFNQAAVGAWVPVSPQLLRAVQTAIEVSRLTQGAYDVTVGPLVRLWGFGPNPPPAQAPAAGELAAARARTGWQHIGIDAQGSRLQRRADIELDLSSLGEGVGVEVLAAELEQRGIHHYLVSVAGTSRAAGRHPDGRLWMVAMEQPDGSGRPGRRLPLANQVVSSSGAYRNVRVLGGQRYSHTIDPATGQPVTHAGMQVTVVLPAAAGAARADALATALNVLGPERGLALADELGLPAYFVSAPLQGGELLPSWSKAFAELPAASGSGR